MAKTSLFRKEVLSQRKDEWLGAVLLTPKISHVLFTFFAVLVTVSILGLLFFGDYTRKARIAGWLVPEGGVTQVFSPQRGVVAEIHVKEGAEVTQGQRLLTLSTERQSAAFGATQKEVVRQLSARRDSLVREVKQLRQLAAHQKRSLESRLAVLLNERQYLETQVEVQERRLNLAKMSEERVATLRQRNLASDQQMQQAQENTLEQDAVLHALKHNQIVLQRDYQTLVGQLEELPVKSQIQIVNIERIIAEVKQELVEAEAARELIIVAPKAGVVTFIQTGHGGRVNTAVPLFSIVPAGTTLKAHLFSSSRTIGFLQPGQRVLLRYQAYPYQKFGHHEGVLESIAGSAMNPGELPSELAGLTSLFGSSEPVYRLTVNLASQTVSAYGESVSLQPGMQLEADVAIEQRRLFEWMLDPLFSLTGKWQG